MSLTITKTELAAAMAELEEASDDIEETTKRALKAFVEVRDKRRVYYAVRKHRLSSGNLYQVLGPFPTKRAPEKLANDSDTVWAFGCGVEERDAWLEALGEEKCLSS